MALDLSAQANHSVTSTSSDHKNSIVPSLPNYTVFWILTHVGPGEFGDCYTDTTILGTDLTHYILSSEVSASVQNKGGSCPPYNFVHIYACSVFQNWSMAQAFGIYPDSVDRAAIRWPVDMAYGDNNDIWSETLWDGMTINGKTLDQAIQDATYNTTNHAGCYTAYRQSQIAYPQLIGDPFMKLHGVYGGAGLQWCIP